MGKWGSNRLASHSGSLTSEPSLPWADPGLLDEMRQVCKGYTSCHKHVYALPPVKVRVQGFERSIWNRLADCIQSWQDDLKQGRDSKCVRAMLRGEKVERGWGCALGEQA